MKILENRIITPEIIGDKTSILDVKALTDQNDKIEIEVQLKDLHNMEKRTLLYWAREYTASISEGMDYGALPRVITINIVDFDYIKIDRFHTTFHIREDIETSYVLTDVLEIHFLNMVKFRKLKGKDTKSNALCQWLTYFDVNTAEEEVEEIKKMNNAIRKADERLNFVTRDKDFLSNYHRRLMELSDLTTVQNTAIEKGMAAGMEKVAKNALSNGLSIEIVQQITGLDRESIAALQKQSAG